MSREGRIVRELRRAGFKVMTRRQWGSRHLGVYQRRRVTRRFVGPADNLAAHISVTHDTGDVRKDARTIEDIGMDRFGTGWSYNYGLHLSTETIVLGQPHDAAGAHTLNDKGRAGFPSNLNYWMHAIVQMGMPGDPFTPWAVRAAAAIEAAEKKHGAAKDGARWYPHSYFAWKECCCDPFRNKLGRVARTARTILGRRDDPQPPEGDEFDMANIEDVVEAILDEPINVHDPDGNVVTANVTVREILSGMGHLLNQEVPGYFNKAQKSRAPRK